VAEAGADDQEKGAAEVAEYETSEEGPQRVKLQPLAGLKKSENPWERRQTIAKCDQSRTKVLDNNSILLYTIHALKSAL